MVFAIVSGREAKKLGQCAVRHVGRDHIEVIGPAEMPVEPVGNVFGCFVSFNDIGIFCQFCPGAAPLQFLHEPRAGRIIREIIGHDKDRHAPLSSWL